MTVDALQAGPAPVSGNGVVQDVREEDGEWVVGFLSEPRTSPQPLWFHLRCRASEPAQVRFEWLNADSCLGLGGEGNLENVRPVVRLDDGPWERLPTVATDAPAAGCRRLVFSAPAAAVTVDAAFCYPYGPDDMEQTLEELDAEWTADVIGLTGEGRPLKRLRLKAVGDDPIGGCYVIARQHAGETPGSWALDGLLRLLGEAPPNEPVRQVEWCVVPFVDLDGAVEGNYGKDAMPWDFNRAWTPMPMRPEVLSIQHDLQRWAGRMESGLLLDLHAPGGAERAIYQFLPRDERPQAQREAGMSFTSHLSEQFPDIPVEELARVPRYPSRWTTDNTASTWVWDHLGETLGVCIETTYQGMDRWYEPEDYRTVGGRIARAAASWLTARP